MPDETLFEAAASGELSTTEGLMRQAERMLLDAKSSAGLWSFFEQWLAIDEVKDIDKDRAVFPTYHLNELMETVRSIEDVVFEQGDMRELFSVHRALDGALAAHYAMGGEGARRPPQKSSSPKNGL